MPDGPSRYAYALGSPVMFTDREGTFAWVPALQGAGFGSEVGGPVGGLIGGIIGGLAGYEIGQFIFNEEHEPTTVAPEESGKDRSKAAGGSCPRPAGIPDDWFEGQSKKGNGTKWTNPQDSSDWVRGMPGNPGSPDPDRRDPYYKRHKGGAHWDVNGNPVSGDSPDAHIPSDDFIFHP